MDKSKKYIPLLIILAIVVLISYLFWQVRLLAKSKWTPAGYFVKSLGLDKISLYLFFNLNNKGDISLTVAEQNYNIYINGMFVSNVQNPADTTIYANSESRLPFLIDVKTNDLLKAGINNVSALVDKAERDKIKVKIAGVLTIKFGPMTVKKLAFEQESTLGDMKQMS